MRDPFDRPLPPRRDVFDQRDDDFDRTFNRTFRVAAVAGVVWALFWMGVAVTVLVLLWKHFA